MEDVFKFLLVAAVIAIGLVRQFKKEAKKNAGNEPIPMPEADNTAPEDWGGGTYGGYIPEGPKEKSVVKAEKKKTSSKPSISDSYVPTTSMGITSYGNKTTSAGHLPTPAPTSEPQEGNDSEFNIQSAEEARRAIVWSEILQRKY